MSPDEERWAEALQVVKMKGNGAAAFVEERIAALTAAGASDGVARWREIEARIRELDQAERHRQ